MADKKIVFVAFAIEDERQRDFLRGESLIQNAHLSLSICPSKNRTTKIGRREFERELPLRWVNCFSKQEFPKLKRPKMGNQLR